MGRGERRRLWRGRVSHGVAILELKDGKVWRDTRYFAEPFEAPQWRAHLVERMEDT